MGTGIATGENRAVEAAQKAISSPLLEDNTIQGARGVLLNVSGGPDMTLFEVNEASTLVQMEAHDDANIIFGTVIDDSMGDEMRITVIATGFDTKEKNKQNVSTISNFGSHKREDLSTPAFIRKEKSAENPVVIKMGMIDDNENTDYEIPTFLRKQAD
jgi:cell division protein FtsZ